jgi:hypothetical protein
MPNLRLWKHARDEASNRLLSVASSLVFLAGVVAIGCSPSNGRIAVDGKVTLDGEPLSGASILFTSLGEKKLASGAMVEKGEYQIPQAKGLLPGTYRVELSAPDTDAPPIMMGGSPTAPERIPAEYNADSKKTIEVTADGDHHFVFEIVSGKKSR